MIFLDCPLCGIRPSTEFVFWGDVRDDSQPVTDVRAWRRGLYIRDNPSGWARERWMHVAGCGRFIEMERHRSTDELRSPPAGRTPSAVRPR